MPICLLQPAALGCREQRSRGAAEASAWWIIVCSVPVLVSSSSAPRHGRFPWCIKHHPAHTAPLLLAAGLMGSSLAAHRIVEWFGLEGTLKLIFFHVISPFHFSKRPGCSKPRPTWPRALPGIGHPQLLMHGLCMLPGIGIQDPGIPTKRASQSAHSSSGLAQLLLEPSGLFANSHLVKTHKSS